MELSRKDEVAATVLRSIANSADRRGATLTQIMYSAYLSCDHAKELVFILRKKKWVKYKEGDDLYQITTRGAHFLASIEAGGLPTRLGEQIDPKRRRRVGFRVTK